MFLFLSFLFCKMGRVEIRAVRMKRNVEGGASLADRLLCLVLIETCRDWPRVGSLTSPGHGRDIAQI